MASDSSPAERTFAWVDEAVPRYESFHTVAELHERSRKLTAAHDHVDYERLGETAGGEPLWAVTVGEGTHTALWFGAPDANEPIGTLTVDFLASEVATNPAVRDSLDYELVCVPVADPDGVRRNEGWFDGPFTLANYALKFYRTPPDEQVEATFPLEHEGYTFDDPPAGTVALATLIDRYEPDFLYSLHNAAFGGCYYYLTQPLDPIHDTLTSLPASYDVHRGEPEWHHAETYEDGVYGLPTFEAMLADVQQQDGVDPEEALFGGNAYDYASRGTDDADRVAETTESATDEVFELVVELPYFSERQIADQTELDRTREAVIREGVETKLALIDDVRAEIDAVEHLLPETNLARESTGAFAHFADEFRGKRHWAESAPETDQPATVAQQVDEQYVHQYDLLTYLGMLVRAVDTAAVTTDGDERQTLLEAKRSLLDTFHDRLTDLRRALDYQTVPIWKLVAIQARAGLICMDYWARERDTVGHEC